MVVERDLNPVEHLWVVVEREIRSMTVQLTDRVTHRVNMEPNLKGMFCAIRARGELKRFGQQREALPSIGVEFLMKCSVSVHYVM